MTDTLSAGAARRIALAAQGFGGRQRPATPTRRHLDAVVERLGLLQIDSVNVVTRAHYLPLFSRLGAYRPTLLDEAAWGRRRGLFEYWAHEASLVPLATQPFLRWRMARADRHEGIYGGLARFGREQRAAIDAVLDRIRREGPLGASDLDGPRGSGGWWGWSDNKRALEWLFWAGHITAATRRPSFERVYDLPERVLPRAILDQPTPSEADAHRALLRIAARAYGVATLSDLRDYFRLDLADVKARVPELVEAGELLPVTVKGWRHPAFLHRDARHPRRIDAQALLAPFDPVLWERPRAERLFDFRYRLEIYTPADKRQHGYYVLPFLLGDTIVGRVDLKADRQAGVLRVHGAFAEPGAPPHLAEALADELGIMARWLGLQEVAVGRDGDIAKALRAAVKARAG